MKIENEQQAVEEGAVLLERERYQTPSEINEISRKLMAQMLLFRIYRILYGRTNTSEKERIEVSSNVGVGEKALRDWQNGDACPTPEHLINLAKYFNKVNKSKA